MVTGADGPGLRCPHCGYDADPGDEDCPLCGSPLEREEPTAPEAEEGYRGAAWDLDGGRFPDDFVRAWKESVLSPSRFFSGLRPGGSLWRAILFLLVLSVVGAGLGLIWSAGLWGGGDVTAMREALGASSEALGRWAAVMSNPLIGFLAAPFTAILLWVLGTVVFHALVTILVDGHAGLRETARVVAYAWAGPQVFQAIPVLGGTIGSVWSVVLMVIGIREQHGASGGRAAAVVLLPVLLLVFVPMVIGIVAAISVFGGDALVP